MSNILLLTGLWIKAMNRVWQGSGKTAVFEQSGYRIVAGKSTSIAKTWKESLLLTSVYTFLYKFISTFAAWTRNCIKNLKM